MRLSWLAYRYRFSIKAPPEWAIPFYPSLQGCSGSKSLAI